MSSVEEGGGGGPDGRPLSERMQGVFGEDVEVTTETVSSVAAEGAVDERPVADRLEDLFGEGVVDFGAQMMDRQAMEARIGADVADGLSVDEALAQLRNLISYTVVISSNLYAVRTQQIIDGMRENGFEPLSLVNSWTRDDRWLGHMPVVSTHWHDRVTEQAFEVQFHTAPSLQAREGTAKMAEYRHLPGLDEAVEEKLCTALREVFDVVETPVGADSIRF